MLKPTPLLAALLCAYFSFAQRTDTLILHYSTDGYTLSKEDKQKLDSFLSKGWDHISIAGHTDERDGEEYNFELSKKRAGQVYKYFRSKNVPDSFLSEKYFGEDRPIADNATDRGKALNRRTEIIGYRFARLTLLPKFDPMKPVTKNLDNGFIITFTPGTLPEYFAANLLSGSSINFEVFTNTGQMRENNLYNNTTNGEILSSMMIISFDNIPACNVDSPVLLRVPIPYTCDCNIQKLKFFVSVWEKEQRIWKEENKTVFQQVIHGIPYACVWVQNFCGAVNFDFKVPECYDTDSSKLYVSTYIKNLTAEIEGINSVYLPQPINDSTKSILFLKNRPSGTSLSFRIYNGKKRVRSFVDQRLSDLPYDTQKKQYLLSTGKFRFSFPGLNVFRLSVKVNRERYTVFTDKDSSCEVIYLNRKKEKVTVDFTVIDKKGNVSVYMNHALNEFHFDESTGSYQINKEFLKTLKEEKWVASR